MATKLDFVNNNPLNSAVVDAPTGRVLFNVESKGVSGSESDSDGDHVRTRTTIYDAAHGEPVARWEHKRELDHAQDWITYHGKTKLLSDWLPQATENNFSSQTFVAPDGEEYAWEHHKHKLAGKDTCKLVHVRTQTPIAESTYAHGLAFGPTKRAALRLDVQPEGVGMLDAVLLSFVIVEQLRRVAEITTIGTFGMTSVLGMNTARAVHAVEHEIGHEEEKV